MPRRTGLPDLIIIGAPKAGTTTLTSWLRDHPQVAFSERKELEFFDLYYDQGLDWYRAQLPQDGGDKLLAEATPTYLSDAHAPDRIATDLPDARFVVVLREPVARAWSHYWFFVQLGIEGRPWEKAIEQEVEGQPPGYLWRGTYGRQLERWADLVGRDRLHVLLLDDLVRDPDAALAGVCSFAGIERIPVTAPESVNPTRRPRSARLQRTLQHPEAGALRRRLFLWNGNGPPVPRLTDAQRAHVAPLFGEDLKRLQAQLDRPLPESWGTRSLTGALRRSA